MERGKTRTLRPVASDLPPLASSSLFVCLRWWWLWWDDHRPLRLNGYAGSLDSVILCLLVGGREGTITAHVLQCYLVQRPFLLPPSFDHPTHSQLPCTRQFSHGIWRRSPFTMIGMVVQQGRGGLLGRGLGDARATAAEEGGKNWNKSG
ncbi:hypothetical protein BO99DRAFT_258816 [Aspergillus violaceofuscus CBS 115571]|uniref:Uncharacterized protein n=1 Tax=Aspergillus violaceofuscus (strain CBS 115571) TaxID=1450538 RepID=A0A2V5IS64_ASPV1|nr:hypothetical protein BO99DRAFT_258816 [Aspergillus violaceofuscus CBS 115571]